MTMTNFGEDIAGLQLCLSDEIGSPNPYLILVCLAVLCLVASVEIFWMISEPWQKCMLLLLVSLAHLLQSDSYQEMIPTQAVIELVKTRQFPVFSLYCR